MIFLFLLLISPLRVLTGSPQPSSSSSPQVRRRHGALTMVGGVGSLMWPFLPTTLILTAHHKGPSF